MHPTSALSYKYKSLNSSPRLELEEVSYHQVPVRHQCMPMGVYYNSLIVTPAVGCIVWPSKPCSKYRFVVNILNSSKLKDGGMLLEEYVRNDSFHLCNCHRYSLPMARL
ncbi:hypothetical protein BD410DRAFT_308658 [Rickenella mellea]|uniref:Uncharacterized protein n=1 Tax=Rickenella mellea TaxID=50990 RepID=A0A4Y7Q1K9_9AGAM|nr:hypothetical protein BD410DRAFT_308658 [Rickenella mellea]